MYDEQSKKCMCEPGSAIYKDVCSTCPNNFFIFKNYCVTCPINSIYNAANNSCECKEGYAMSRSGFCARKCAIN